MMSKEKLLKSIMGIPDFPTLVPSPTWSVKGIIPKDGSKVFKEGIWKFTCTLDSKFYLCNLFDIVEIPIPNSGGYSVIGHVVNITKHSTEYSELNLEGCSGIPLDYLTEDKVIVYKAHLIGLSPPKKILYVPEVFDKELYVGVDMKKMQYNADVMPALDMTSLGFIDGEFAKQKEQEKAMQLGPPLEEDDEDDPYARLLREYHGKK